MVCTVSTGNWFIPVLNVPGRSHIGIHGGGTGLTDPFESSQGWVATVGCIRMQNEDLNTLVSLINRDRECNQKNQVHILPCYPSNGFGR